MLSSVMGIDLQPIGEIASDVLTGISTGLAGAFGNPVRINPAIGVPESSYVPDRNQYLADLILAVLKTHQKADRRLLGVADINIYSQGLNFVFGQADYHNRIGVISLTLLKQENYGLPGDTALLIERAQKEAVHELGHTFGLGHCQDGTCVMHFSNSLIDTDVKKVYFCRRCQPKLVL
ncbi:MAG: archaemetzincin family Zn-dependent metalloprotease [Chloroflexi bacterium]|nr:archaemetzincin family Zn-dependent metalloprotease [Chloroflexota bacterium]